MLCPPFGSPLRPCGKGGMLTWSSWPCQSFRDREASVFAGKTKQWWGTRGRPKALPPHPLPQAQVPPLQATLLRRRRRYLGGGLNQQCSRQSRPFGPSYLQAGPQSGEGGIPRLQGEGTPA